MEQFEQLTLFAEIDNAQTSKPVDPCDFCKQNCCYNCPFADTGNDK